MFVDRKVFCMVWQYQDVRANSLGHDATTIHNYSTCYAQWLERALCKLVNFTGPLLNAMAQMAFPISGEGRVFFF